MSTARHDQSDAGTAECGRAPRTRHDTRTRYDIRIRTAVIPALVASFPVQATAVVVPRKAVYRLGVDAQQNIADVVRRLVESGLDVLEVRRTVRVPPSETPSTGSTGFTPVG